MKKITYVCDMCGKEIIEKIMKVDIKCVDKETGGILDFDAYEECKELEDEKHLCQDCVKKIIKRKNNTGDRNTGDRNTGNRNTGDYNTGDWNTGDWNKSSFNTGCFMTEEQKIMLFDKPSDWTYRDWLNSDARHLLDKIPKNVVEWIRSDDMTNEEKEDHPTHETVGGYLKVLDESESGQLWWNNLSFDEKNIIMGIQNFDKEKFKKITGINVDG